MRRFSIGSCGEWPLSGSTDVLLSWVKTEENWVFRAFALPSLVEYILPSTLSVGIPADSLLWALTYLQNLLGSDIRLSPTTSFRYSLWAKFFNSLYRVSFRLVRIPVMWWSCPNCFLVQHIPLVHLLVILLVMYGWLTLDFAFRYQTNSFSLAACRSKKQNCQKT